jgi:guanine deaminase
MEAERVGINESPAEIRAVGELFGWASDYLHAYERFGLVGPSSVLAHDVHVTAGELERLAEAQATVAHCPTSNASLGSGTFPMRSIWTPGPASRWARTSGQAPG